MCTCCAIQMSLIFSNRKGRLLSCLYLTVEDYNQESTSYAWNVKFIITRQVTQKGESSRVFFSSVLSILILLWLGMGYSSGRRGPSLCSQCEYITIASSTTVKDWMQLWALWCSAGRLRPHSRQETPAVHLRKHCRLLVLLLSWGSLSCHCSRKQF